MDSAAIEILLLELGIDKEHIKDSGRGWINSPCPLAEYTHGSGKDENPSFGISVNEDGVSSWYCFGCRDEPQPLFRLVHEIWLHTKEYPFEIAKFVLRNEYNTSVDELVSINYKPVEWSLKSVKKSLDKIPGKILRNYPLVQGSHTVEAKNVYKYLIEKRKISKYVIHRFGVRYHAGHDTVVFPLTSKNGDIMMMRERVLHEKKMWTISPKVCGLGDDVKFPKITEYGMWFGLNVLDHSKPVILVEAEIDCMRLATLGFSNSVATCSTSVTESQLKKLSNPIIYLGYDADLAGEKAVKRVSDFFKYRSDTQILKLDWSLSDCGDPGDLPNRRALNHVLDNYILT